jgi:predicted nucleic acid-binding protein
VTVRYTVDTSCVVALALAHHVHHAATLAAVESLEAGGFEPVLVGHVLVESYAVLTRLRAGSRLHGADALAALEGSWGAVPAAALERAGHWDLVRWAAGNDMSGGRLYDALIAHSALGAGVDLLLSWNERHFRQLELAALRVVRPDEADTVLAGGSDSRPSPSQ